MEYEHVGNFNVNSGKLTISDPCYERGCICAATVNAKNGTWKAYIVHMNEGMFGNRVSELIAIHSDYSSPDYVAFHETINDDIGVDSGQAGIFDDASFVGRTDENESWYEMICKKTLTKKGGGVVNGGCASQSGVGDGGYPATGHSVDGVFDAIRICFLEDNDKYEEDEYEYEEDEYEEDDDEPNSSVDED